MRDFVNTVVYYQGHPVDFYNLLESGVRQKQLFDFEVEDETIINEFTNSFAIVRGGMVSVMYDKHQIFYK